MITQDDLPEDLRNDPNLRTRAFIGDLRNDENLIVAQFHLAFLRFHNEVIERIEDDPRAFGLRPGRGRGHRAERFEHARQLTRFHYQWLVVNDYLKTVTLSGIADKVLVGGLKHYRPRVTRGGAQLFMPLEYSVAAFRFGHSMVRGGYDHNRNFGKRLPGQGEGQPLAPFASFDLLFAFTGNGFARDRNDPSKSIRNPFLGQGPALPFNWIIEWDRLTNKADPDEAHFAGKIDTRLAPPINQMVNEGTAPDIQDDAHKPLRVLLRHLARRKPAARLSPQHPDRPERRGRDGRTGSVAGRAAKRQLGRPQRCPRAGRVYRDHTPLVLRAQGGRGPRERQLLGRARQPDRVRDRHRPAPQRPELVPQRPGGWDPSEGVKLDNGDPIVTIRDFLSFAGVPA